MIAGNDKHLDAGIDKALQFLGHHQVAHALAVLGEVARDEGELRLLLDDVIYQGVKNLGALAQHLAVSHQVFLKGVPLFNQQLRRHDVQVADDSHLDRIPAHSYSSVDLLPQI